MLPQSAARADNHAAHHHQVQKRSWRRRRQRWQLDRFHFDAERGMDAPA
jgi:hypothetical protein